MKDNNTELEEFIYMNKNDSFSKMNSFELIELFNLLNNFYLELRDTLNINKNVTFGLELEMEKTKKKLEQEKFNKNFLGSDWKIKNDESLFKGTEVNSPIMSDDKIKWKKLDEVCELLKKYSTIGIHSAGHIHIGSQILGQNKENWINFIYLWAVYENIMYRFSYGEYLTSRVLMPNYASPVAERFNEFYKTYKSFPDDYENVAKVLNGVDANRYHAVNLSNVNLVKADEITEGNTIEFRCPNGTLNPIIWQNNVNLLIKFLEYSKSPNYDLDKINKRKELIFNGTLQLYNEIYIDQALELADMIFDNNLDKIYFLRQYTKSFEIGINVLQEAKPFTRKK